LRGGAPFLFGTAVALVAGIVSRVRTGLTPVAFLLFTALAVAPLAASTFGEPQAIGNALLMVPLVVVFAVDGVSNWLGRLGWAPWFGLGAIAALVIDAVWFVAS